MRRAEKALKKQEDRAFLQLRQEIWEEQLQRDGFNDRPYPGTLAEQGAIMGEAASVLFRDLIKPLGTLLDRLTAIRKQCL